MMDYESMSDFEINKLVARHYLEHGQHMDIFEDIKGKAAITCFLANPQGESINVFIGDFCNDPSDAWPIIVENRISIIWDDEWVAVEDGGLEHFLDPASLGFGYVSPPYSRVWLVEARRTYPNPRKVASWCLNN